LLVAYYASAEIGCHLSLGWPRPVSLLDLFAEFRNHTNGLTPPCGNGLIGALTWFGLSGIEAVEKESMRQLVLRGGPWTQEERAALLDYCESDVPALARLLGKMADIIITCASCVHPYSLIYMSHGGSKIMDIIDTKRLALPGGSKVYLPIPSQKPPRHKPGGSLMLVKALPGLLNRKEPGARDDGVKASSTFIDHTP